MSPGWGGGVSKIVPISEPLDSRPQVWPVDKHWPHLGLVTKAESQAPPQNYWIQICNLSGKHRPPQKRAVIVLHLIHPVSIVWAHTWPRSALRDRVVSWEGLGLCHHTDLGSKVGSAPMGLGGSLIWSVSSTEKSLVCFRTWSPSEPGYCRRISTLLVSKFWNLLYKFLHSDEIAKAASFRLTGSPLELFPVPRKF